MSMSSTIVLPTGELETREHSNTTTTTEIDKERRRQQQQTTSTGVTTTAVAMGREGEGEVATTVCCGCRPRKSKYFDVDVGADSVWENNDDDDDSMYFFDAEQEPLGPDDYPIVFTTSLQRPKPKVSFKEPKSMLRDFQDPEDDSSTNSDTAEKSSSSSPSPDYAPIKNFKIPSARFREITRRSSVEIQNALETPRVKCEERGYPGGLTVEELKECQKFLRGLKALDPRVSEQVYSFRDIEDEPYTICRWLRATKFDAEAILKRLDENQAMFEAAKQHNFFPDVTKAIGAPFSVYLSQYPLLPIGRGKNGCPVNYFQAGKLNPEGIFTLTTLPKVQGYFWWTFMWKMKEEIINSQNLDPDFVRVEGINVVDLNGLSAAALTSEAMEVIKIASKISDFFPETLHCMLVLNAPKFFSLSWGLIKKFIDPRTAQRIHVYSSGEKGMTALRQMVDQTEIPVDYGGTNVSISEAFRKEAEDPELLRQDIQLLYVRQKSKATAKQTWELKQGECMTITAYTRSVSGGSITVLMNGVAVKTVEASCRFEGPEEAPSPNAITLVSKLSGPGTVSLKIKDLNNADSQKYRKESRGYFLLVGDVKEDKID